MRDLNSSPTWRYLRELLSTPGTAGQANILRQQLEVSDLMTLRRNMLLLSGGLRQDSSPSRSPAGRTAMLTNPRPPFPWRESPCGASCGAHHGPTVEKKNMTAMVGNSKRTTQSLLHSHTDPLLTLHHTGMTPDP